MLRQAPSCNNLNEARDAEIRVPFDFFSLRSVSFFAYKNDRISLMCACSTSSIFFASSVMFGSVRS